MRSTILVLLAACGGNSHTQPKQPKEDAKPDTYWEWHKSEPKSPEEPVRTTRFQPPQQCGQGPYRFTVDAVSARYAESLKVEVCTSHGFKGTVSYVAPGHAKSESGFGEANAFHDKCRVDATVVASSGAASGGSGKPGKAGAPGKAATPAKTAAPVELHGELIATGEKCPDGQSELSVVNTTFSTGENSYIEPPLRAGPITIEVWSDLPNDLTGVTVLVRQLGGPTSYKAEDWLAYRRAHDAWYKRHDEALAQAIANGHQWKTVEPTAPTAQPPPPRSETQSPRPSPNAAWIPGYWQDSGKWEWSAGFWRVPKQDIEQEKTVEAPAPPPAPKPDIPTLAYHRNAVWTPGHWMWDGRMYIWLEGAWRIPEAAGMTWVTPTWRPTRRGTSIYIPGGFVRRR